MKTLFARDNLSEFLLGVRGLDEIMSAISSSSRTDEFPRTKAKGSTYQDSVIWQGPAKLHILWQGCALKGLSLRWALNGKHIVQQMRMDVFVPRNLIKILYLFYWKLSSETLPQRSGPEDQPLTCYFMLRPIHCASKQHLWKRSPSVVIKGHEDSSNHLNKTFQLTLN